MKQIPTDTQYFISLLPSITLNYFNADAAASTTSYVSGAAAGNFTQSNVNVQNFDGGNDISGISGLALFRDMGKTVISSGRMFRRVQLLRLDGNGSTGWTSSTTAPGVWQAGVEGVNGTVPTSGTSDSAYSVFYFETGARGLGIAQGLIRYG
jgi:hypothetical protein